MPTSDQDPQKLVDSHQPDQPIPPGNGNGNGNGHPRPVRITSVSPIGGALAGGIDVTISGSGFQPEAEVFFGSNQSPEVTFVSSGQVTAKAPAATETGSVDVRLVNPDGSFATLAGAYTYVRFEGSLHAEVLSIEPTTVIEDTESEITVRGHNLVAAYNEGIVALRGSSRVEITYSNVSSSTDEATGIDSLVFAVRITCTPPLEQHERKAIQVLASLRPGAGTDGLFDTSRQMFAVLPRAVPVMLAFTATVDPAKPNLVVVAGRNLEGCSLDLGQGATIHVQRSDDRTVAALVTFPDDAPAPPAAQLKVLDPEGGEAGQFEMTVAPALEMSAMKAASEMAAGDAPAGVGDPGQINLTLTPVPGQQILGPTATDSKVFPLREASVFSVFDFGDFYVRIFERTIRIQLFDEVRVIPFFDNGVGDALSQTPVVAQVGKLFRLRGMGLLVALHVDLFIHIEIVLIIGFRFEITPFSFFNEFFDDYPFAIGSLVISIRFAIAVDIDFLVSFVVALILPGGSLKILFFFRLSLDIDFGIDKNGNFYFGKRFTHKVRFFRVGPLLNLPRPCEGRFQLAEDQGQSVFTDSFGGQVSYYFPRTAGPCCIPWEFGLELVRFEEGGPEQETQGRFRAEFCLNALDSENLIDVKVVSNQKQDGFPPPPPETLSLGETDVVRAIGLSPTGERIDLSTVALVKFHLVHPPSVLDRDLLKDDGDVLAIAPGENAIEASVTSVNISELPPDQIPPEIFFSPDSVTGFDILSFLAQGLLPAIKAGNLPVIVNAPVAGELTVSFDVGYLDNSNPPKFVSTSVLERNEPFEPQRDFQLRARIVLGEGVTKQQTLTLKVDDVSRMAPLAGFSRNRTSSDPKLFFTGALARKDSQVSINLRDKDLSKPIDVAGLTIKPNNIEEGTITKPDDPLTKLVPPGHAVKNADTQITITLKVTSDDPNTTVRISQQLQPLTVSNDETFEEYLRVFQEVTDILNGPGSDGFFKGFDAAFYNELKAKGATASVLNEQGKKLWDHAWQNVGTLKDDRPLYWTRLRAIAALRAFAKRQTTPITGGNLNTLITQFEWPSRGLQPSGQIVFTAPAFGARTAVITGFDPFSLVGEADASNPSGLVALSLNQKVLGSMPPVTINAAVFPVRFKDFNNRIVENALPPTVLSSIAMLMTISQNGSQDFYDVERWAARTRGPGSDNNNQLETPVVLPTGDQFLQSTLPFGSVITSAEEIQGPSEKGKAPFVIDQAYSVKGEIGIAVNRKKTPDPPDQRAPARAPDFRPSPLLDDKDQAAFVVKPDQPDKNKTSQEGSGSNFLSNEIFYRVALLRDATKPTLSSGHLHIPPFTEDTTQNPLGGQRDRLLNGTQSIVERFLAKVPAPPAITSFSPLSGRTGTRVTVLGANFTDTVAVLIGGGEVGFLVERDDKITATVTIDATTGPIQVQTPNGTAISEHFFTVLRGPRGGDLGAELLAKRTELGMTPKVAAQQIGVSAGTYRRWEQGKDKPSARYHPAVVNFLGHDPDRDPKEFGKEISTAREKDGLTPAQLAKQLGVSTSTVKAWEAGTVERPSPRVESIFENYLKED